MAVYVMGASVMYRQRSISNSWLVVAALGFITVMSDGALAQQSSHAASISGASGATLERAVTGSDGQVIGTLGNGLPLPLVTPTGSLQSFRHDGFDAPNYVYGSSQSFSGLEESFFMNGMFLAYRAQGAAAYVGPTLGFANLDLNLGPHRTPLPFDKNDNGSAHSKGAILGGRALFYQQSLAGTTYIVGSLNGLLGDTAINDKQFGTKESNYDYFGVAANLVLGQTLPIVGGAGSTDPGNLKLDVHGGLTYTNTTGNSFEVYSPAGVRLQSVQAGLEALLGTLSLRAYSDVRIDQLLLRPYIRGVFSSYINYNNFVDVRPESGGLYNYRFYQSKWSTSAEIGTTFQAGKISLDGSTYYNYSADHAALGGRLGVSVELN